MRSFSTNKKLLKNGIVVSSKRGKGKGNRSNILPQLQKNIMRNKETNIADRKDNTIGATIKRAENMPENLEDLAKCPEALQRNIIERGVEYIFARLSLSEKRMDEDGVILYDFETYAPESTTSVQALMLAMMEANLSGDGDEAKRLAALLKEKQDAKEAKADK